MLRLLWLIPILPLISMVLLGCFGARLSKRACAIIGAGGVGLAAVLALQVSAALLQLPSQACSFSQTLWTWFHVEEATAGITFYLDSLSMVMMLVVTVVSFLILIYSTRFMIEEENYRRFFCYMNLFVSSMLILVLADNLLLLYLGWEGVGLCSYLLIGFWYKERANVTAAMKAFLVTRIGDTALIIGIILIFTSLGTFQIQQVMQDAVAQWTVGSGIAVLVAALLLGGAVGKSAQLPLQTWLPDAMAGPTPVSALIHAATMVTAGVYLIARMHVLFTLAPQILTLVAIIGAVTLLYAGFSALTQWDLKRILAYSTMSQLGYMFLALGVGAWSAAIFHFVTHAFFKSLLFLAAGVVISSMKEEHNIFKMGGLAKRLPVVCTTFLVGALALTALPWVSGGFYSKELILFDAWAAQGGSPWYWGAAMFGALLTTLYTFRMFFLVFWGKERGQVLPQQHTTLLIPLLVLAVFVIGSMLLQVPSAMANNGILVNLLSNVLPLPTITHGGAQTEFWLQLASGIITIGAIVLTYFVYARRQWTMHHLAYPLYANPLQRFLLAGWQVDRLYHFLFIRPFLWLARVNKGDVTDAIYGGIAWLCMQAHGLLSKTVTGKVRCYTTSITLGAILLLLLLVFR